MCVLLYIYILYCVIHTYVGYRSKIDLTWSSCAQVCLVVAVGRLSALGH